MQSETQLSQIYLCDKDLKLMIYYNIKQNSIVKKPIDMQTKFEHNF
jgi:hypothetical protein